MIGIDRRSLLQSAAARGAGPAGVVIGDRVAAAATGASSPEDAMAKAGKRANRNDRV